MLLISYMDQSLPTLKVDTVLTSDTRVLGTPVLGTQ